MSEPAIISRDEDHVRLLAIFHYVCAGLTALAACVPLIYVMFGLVMWFSPEIFGPRQSQPPRFIGMFFVMIGLTFALLGWTLAALLAFAGRSLSQRKRYTFCLVMACVGCMFMPFGTILGIFTLIVLMRPEVKRMFGQPTPA